MADERADEPDRDHVDLTCRVVVITGANTGIGKATAADLAGRGAELILACRSEAKARPVIDELQAASGNDAIEFLPLDLGDLSSVRRAAAQVLGTDRPIHVLVNNAGLAGQRGQTADGFELAFGTNHLGHFLFTTLLLDRLRSSAEPGAPARVVNVASGSHFDAPGIAFDALQQSTPSIVGMREYSVSKLANVLFTQQLAQRVDPAAVAVFATDPGPVHTDVWRRIPGPIYAVFRRVMRQAGRGGRRPQRLLRHRARPRDPEWRLHRRALPRRPAQPHRHTGLGRGALGAQRGVGRVAVPVRPPQ